MTAVWVSLAGSLGAMTRFVLDGHIKSRHSNEFPWATFIINVSGSIILGFVSGILLTHKGFADSETIIGVGFCGGYTTFSTASFETVRLLERQDYTRAIGNAAGGLVSATLAAAIGFALGQLL